MSPVPVNAEPNPPDRGAWICRACGTTLENWPLPERLQKRNERIAELEAALRECARRSGFMLHTPRRYVLKPGEVETEWTPDIEPFPHTENCFGCKLAALLPSPVQQEKP